MYQLKGRIPASAGRALRTAAIGLAIAGLPATANASAISDVNDALIASIRSAPIAPPRASRAIAMVEIAMFDAVNASTGARYDSYGYVGGKLVNASPEAAAYAAGYGMLAKLFPARAAVLLAERDARLGALAISAPKLANSAALGSGIADNLFVARAGDGNATAQPPYVFGTGPGAFQSTAGGAQPALPGWGLVTPFVLAGGDQFRLSAPPAPGSAAFIANYQQVRDLGCATCGTAEQQDIARFWADGPGTITPPGHWVEIGSSVATTRGLSLMQEAQLMAAIGASVADAGISAWDSKYTYNYWRPITAIQACTMADCGVEGDASWTPYLATPNFPSYASGHSTFSGSAAGALAGVFGSDAFDFCVSPDPIVPVAQRCFSSFSAAAAEAGISRIYGGIHFEFDNGPALAAGAGIGAYVAANAFGGPEVPEPATWAMMIIGFGAVGGALRRRRPAATPG
jgi:membrane-associated phospholipid phosphatase